MKTVFFNIDMLVLIIFLLRMKFLATTVYISAHKNTFSFTL